MATTTNYGWTTPDDTALVKDGASAIRTLGSSIDTSLNNALGTKKAGLVLLNTTSFSAVASASLPTDTFTATYENYLIVVNFTSTGNINVRMRLAGTDASGGDYNNQQFGGDGSSASIAQTSAQTSWKAAASAGSRSTINLWVYGPKLAQPTVMLSENSRQVAAANIFFFGGGHNVSTAYDSLTLLDAGSSMTGKYSVYGMNFQEIMMAKSEVIKIQDGDTVIELTGADKEAFIAQRKADQEAHALLEAEYKAKQEARESAIKKLAEIAGLTKDELASIL